MAKDPIASLFIDIRAGIEKLQQDMNSAVGVVTGTSKKIENIVGGVQKIFQAAFVVTGVAAVRQLGQAVVGLEQQLVGLARQGNQVVGVARAFDMLGGSVAQIAAAQQALRGLVDDTDLMALANDALLRGIPGINEAFAQLAELGGKVGIATGKTAKEGIEGLFAALESGRPKQLAAYGLIVDTTQAYADYVKGTDLAADKLDDLQKKEAVLLQVLGQREAALKRLGPVQDSVTVAHTSMSIALGDLWEEIGKVIDRNPAMIKGFQDMEKLLTDEGFLDNLRKLAENLATITGKIVQLGAAISQNLAPLSDWRQLLLAVVDPRAFVSGRIAQNLAGGAGGGSLGHLPGFGPNDLPGLDAYMRLSGGSAPIAGSRRGVKSEEQLAAEAREAEKLREQLARIGEEWERLTDSAEQKGLGEAIKRSIKDLDEGSFRAAMAGLEGVLEREFSEKVADAVAKGFKPTPEMTATLHEAMVTAPLAGFEEEWADQSAKAAEDLNDKLREAFEDSVNFWGDIFETVIEGSAGDFKRVFQQVMKDIAVGFASQIAASLSGGFSIQGGMGGIGQAIAASIGFGGPAPAGGGLGGIGSQIAGGAGLGSLIGSFGMSGAAASAAGIQGPAMASGMFVEGSGALGALGAMGPVGWAALAAGGTYMLGENLGWWGGKANPARLARGTVESYLEDSTGRNFMFGSTDRFRKPGWASGLDDLGGAKGGFLGIGEGLIDLLGITEDIGPQIALILSENVGGSLEGLGSLLDELGLSFEEMSEKIIQSGLEANDTWLEIESTLAGVQDAFGHTGKGAKTLGDAFAVIAGSEGKGMGAVEALRRLAEIAKAAGGKTIEDLRKMMEAQGVGTGEQRGQLFEAFAMRGIASLDQLAEASTRTGGAVIADITAMGFEWEKVAAAIDKARLSAEGFGAAVGELPVPTAGGGGVAAHALGGVVDSPTFFSSRSGLGLMGEAGPEAILPLTRVNGRLGVSALGGGGGRGDIVVNVNAPYSAPGQEVHIAAVVEEAVERAVMAVTEGIRSGGSFAATFGM